MHKLDILQQKLEYKFIQLELLKTALTHRSFSTNHNERLEFLGDAVLELAISTWIYQEYAMLPEGELSRIRSNVVCKEVLAQIAMNLELSKYLYLGMGELKSGGANKASILADALEAILGAIYLEAGLTNALFLVKKLFTPYIENFNISKNKDGKTSLQEYLQGNKITTPQYLLQNIEGYDHLQTFTIECIVKHFDLTTIAKAGTKKEAEQLAATYMLEKILALPKLSKHKKFHKK